jgi:hypothetical protein
MTSNQAKNLTFVTGVVLVVGTIIEGQVITSGYVYKAGTSTTGAGVGKNLGKAALNETASIYRYFPRFIAIALSMLLLAFFADQVPEVAGPLALLIMVAFLVHETSYIKAFYSHLGA